MKRMAIFIGIYSAGVQTQLNSVRGRYAWNESNGRESAQKDRVEDRDEGREDEGEMSSRADAAHA